MLDFLNPDVASSEIQEVEIPAISKKPMVSKMQGNRPTWTLNVYIVLNLLIDLFLLKRECEN